ncbi:TrkH family potassium uptake protein [Sneathiella glossodoripedis]|uniref:TrkH family potassium uptake protein n=1 Tax=Sneathiella glossodoripedis TaxID=418853 RepID=UPI00131F06E7|nr:potassium transporter TrkG [Sneathiella glossodoripedis]
MTVIGWSLTLLSALMVLPCLFALERASIDIAAAFFVSAIVTLFFGGALVFASRGQATALNRRNTFMIAAVIWVIIPAFAALPFYLSGLVPSLLDAFFEALSGFTTNGASVMEGLDDMPRSIILWRALIQWFGGFALIIIVSMLASVISIPGGSPLSRALAKSTRRRLSRRVRDAVLSTLSVYAILTGLCIVLLWFSGLSAFNALCYGFSTLSTGGFLVSDNGFELFENRMTEIVLIIFMFAGAINFSLHWAFFNGNRKAYFENSEYRYLIYVFLALVIGLMVMLSQETHFEFLQTLRYSIFNAMSFLTTTGYVMSPLTESGDIYWPVGTLMLLFIALTIGGSTGSTSGGLKLMRVAILVKLVLVEVRNLSFPSAVVLLKYGKDKITKDHLLATWAFFTFYVFTILIVALGLSLSGIGLQGGLALASANLANAGSAIDFIMIGGGEHNGGIASYGGLPAFAKILLCFTMVIGRLEFFAILALFNPALWKR